MRDRKEEREVERRKRRKKERKEAHGGVEIVRGGVLPGCVHHYDCTTKRVTEIGIENSTITLRVLHLLHTDDFTLLD